MARWQRQLGAGLIVVSALVWGCNRQAQGPAKPAPPATVAQPVKENQLNTIVLTEVAVKRLGLQTGEVERKPLPRLRAYGGEVTLPSGALLVLAAPVSGTLQLPDRKAAPSGSKSPAEEPKIPPVGAPVAEGQPIFTLVPHVLTQSENVALAQANLALAQARIDAEGLVKQANVQVDAAKISFERAKRLYEDRVGIKKDFDDALAQLHLAEKARDAALLRQKLADGMEIDTSRGSVKPLQIASPIKGIMRATYVVPGQVVSTGSPLFEVMNVDTVWVKVPVYVGELADVAEGKPARVRNLADPAGATGVVARPVPTPPTAQPQASAVDLYYELPNPEGKYRPGQRVSAVLTLKGEEQSLRLPWSAVVHDIYGGTWVYVQTAERTFARRRVQVKYVVNDWAVLGEGPDPGTKVVTAGAAEVFGTEFGFGK